MDENTMDSHLTGGHTSLYPDPEESGLSFPWLHRYQPVDAAELTGRLCSPSGDGPDLPQVESHPTARYGLRKRRSPSNKFAREEDQQQQSVGTDESEGDLEFTESNDESGLGTCMQVLLLGNAD